MGHSRSSLKCPTSPPLYPCLSFKPKCWANLSLFQWRIQGRGPVGPPPLFLDQTKAVRSEKNFLDFWIFGFHINQNPWDDPGNIANNNNDFAKFWGVNKVHLVYVKMVNSPYQEPITRLLPLCVFTSNEQISFPSHILKL